MRLDLESLLLIAILTGCSSQSDPPDNAQSSIATPVDLRPEPSVPPTLPNPDTSVTPPIDTVRNATPPRERCTRLPGHYEQGTSGPLSGRWVEGPLVCDPTPDSRLLIPPARADSSD